MKSNFEFSESSKSKLQQLANLKGKIENIKRKYNSVINDDFRNRLNELQVETLIQFSHNINDSISAPKGWTPGAKGHPPAPQAEEMRRGLLYNIDSLIIRENQSVFMDIESKEEVIEDIKPILPNIQPTKFTKEEKKPAVKKIVDMDNFGMSSSDEDEA